jgi:hypothetical protein
MNMVFHLGTAHNIWHVKSKNQKIKNPINKSISSAESVVPGKNTEGKAKSILCAYLKAFFLPKICPLHYKDRGQ